MPVGFPPPDDQTTPQRGSVDKRDESPRGSPAAGPAKPRSDRAQRGELLQDLGSTAGLGLQCGAILTACTLGGLWLDRRLGTLPWLLLAGVTLGLITGFYLIIQRSR
jgi:Putative F0F1-ATPase subunit Ca2+/Mg2+ transporter